MSGDVFPPIIHQEIHGCSQQIIPRALKVEHVIQQRAKKPEDVIRVLKSGKESRKIGDRIIKGKWKGMPIFTLTLEERATCPRSCQEWLSCYGNKMHWSHRFSPTPELMNVIERELQAYQTKHPGGFVVRLHVLGDFISVDYVECWRRWLDQFPSLHIFGYTAHAPKSAIGRAISLMPWERAALRFSGSKKYRGAVTVADAASSPLEAIICPAQTNKTDCCGTCGLCWGTKRLIAFLRH